MISTQAIKAYAYTLGFDSVAITTAEEFPEARHIMQQRIARGLMDGLPWFTAERAEVSSRPTALLPEARSIISLGKVYLTEPPQEQSGTTPRGRISRYAWGDDYHDTIKPQLQQVATWLRAYVKQQ